MPDYLGFNNAEAHRGAACAARLLGEGKKSDLRRRPGRSAPFQDCVSQLNRIAITGLQGHAWEELKTEITSHWLYYACHGDEVNTILKISAGRIMAYLNEGFRLLCDQLRLGRAPHLCCLCFIQGDRFARLPSSSISSTVWPRIGAQPSKAYRLSTNVSRQFGSSLTLRK